MSAPALLGLMTACPGGIKPDATPSELMDDAGLLNTLARDIISLISIEMMQGGGNIAASPEKAGNALYGALKLLEVTDGLNVHAQGLVMDAVPARAKGADK